MDCGSDNKYSPYPRNGRAFNYDFRGARMQELITGNDSEPKPLTGTTHIILEAEFYTDNTSIWDPAVRTAGQGYWALQRRFGTNAFSIDGYGYSGNADARSGFVRHHSFMDFEWNMEMLPYGRHYTLDDARGLTSYPAPRLDYAFEPT